MEGSEDHRREGPECTSPELCGLKVRSLSFFPEALEKLLVTENEVLAQ